MNPQPRADYIETLNRSFERLGAWSFDRRNRVLAACLVLLVAAFYFAGVARFDASGRGAAVSPVFEEHLVLFESGQPVREE